MYTASELASSIGMNKIPITLEKYVIEAYNCQPEKIDFLENKYTLDAFEFYDLTTQVHFCRLYMETLHKIRKDPLLKQLVWLLHYILLKTPGDDFKEAWSWKASFKNIGNSILPVIVLFSGFKKHEQALKKIDKVQKKYQVSNIRGLIERGLNIYQIEGISFSSLIWGIYFIKQLLIKIGRLQYENSYFKEPYYIYKSNKSGKVFFINEEEKEKNTEKLSNAELLLAPFDKCISIHIERGEPLDKGAVSYSLKRAHKKIPDYFPEIRGKKIIYRCHSWLLSPQMSLFLDSSTRIIHFKNRFLCLPPFSDDIGKDFLKFLFNTIDSSIDYTQLPEKTSLQQRVKQYLINGGKLQEGRGILIP